MQHGPVEYRAYNNFRQDTIVLRLHVNGSFVGFLHSVSCDECPRVSVVLTISSNTSPVEKVSPSFFFHEAIPPSDIVGLIAGMLKYDSAFRRAET
jgi:hypothetical protein